MHNVNSIGRYPYGTATGHDMKIYNDTRPTKSMKTRRLPVFIGNKIYGTGIGTVFPDNNKIFKNKHNMA
jgi:hypothetical protein